MPTELQELQLRVALMDEATAGIASLRDQLKGLTEGEGKKNLEKLKEQQAELGKQIKELAELAEGGSKAMLSYIGKFGAAGAAFGGFAATLVVGLHSLKEYADRITDLTNKAKVIGMNPAELKNIIEQYERLGISASQTEQNMSGLSDALAQVGRLGSQRREEMIRSAGQFSLAMMEGIEKIERQSSMAGKVNEILIQTQNVYDNRLKETNGNEADANKAANDYLKLWGLDPSIRIASRIKEVSEEEKKRMEEKAKATAAYRTALFDLTKEWEDWADDIKTSMLSADGVIVSGLQLALRITKELRELWTKPWVQTSAKAAAGASLRMLPGIGTAMTTFDLLRMAGVGGGTAPAAAPEGAAPPPEPQAPLAPITPAPEAMAEARRKLSEQMGGRTAAPTQFYSGGAPETTASPDGFSQPGFSKGWEWMRRSDNIEDRRQNDQSLSQGEDYLKAIEANTAQVKKLNENFKLLDEGQVELKGLGDLPGFSKGAAQAAGGQFGGGGATGGWTGAPNGSDAGPGSGSGAGDSHPGTGTGGGTKSPDEGTGTTVDPGAGIASKAGDAGGVARTYERRRGERGEFNYAETGAFGKPGTNQVWITLSNGKKVQVNREGAEKFKGLFNELLARGYKINDIGGLSVRQKRGGGGLSEHSWGTAVDVNPGQNAYKGNTTNLPSDVEEMAWKHGVSWGGRFGDPMHFEIMSPDAAAHKMQILKDRGYIDSASADKSVRSVKVDVSGKLTADVNAPRGSDVKVSGDGAFKNTETNRTMAPDSK